MNHGLVRLGFVAACAAMLGALALSLGLVAFHRSRARLPQIDRLSGTALLQYHWTWRLLAAVLAISCLIFPLAALHSPPKGWGWIVIGATTVLSLGGSIALLIEVSGVRIAVDDAGIRYRSPWRRDRFMRWDEITGISWRFANGLEVRSDACKMTIPQYVQGLPYLYGRVQLHVPQELYRETGIQFYRETRIQ
jgi:hypothetical protein